jgi:hypothetical protein
MLVVVGSGSGNSARERDADWSLPLRGYAVTQCQVDYAFSLLLTGAEREATVRIERSFTVSRPDREVTWLEPGRDWERLGPALGLFGLTTTGGTAYRDGGLKLQFQDGTRLEVPPDAAGFEAWELVVSTGLRIMSLPNGGLAVWRGEEVAE